jgi:chromosome segregation ATPase
MQRNQQSKEDQPTKDDSTKEILFIKFIREVATVLAEISKVKNNTDSIDAIEKFSKMCSTPKDLRENFSLVQISLKKFFQTLIGFEIKSLTGPMEKLKNNLVTEMIPNETVTLDLLILLNESSINALTELDKKRNHQTIRIRTEELQKLKEAKEKLDAISPINKLTENTKKITSLEDKLKNRESQIKTFKNSITNCQGILLSTVKEEENLNSDIVSITRVFHDQLTAFTDKKEKSKESQNIIKESLITFNDKLNTYENTHKEHQKCESKMSKDVDEKESLHLPKEEKTEISKFLLAFEEMSKEISSLKSHVYQLQDNQGKLRDCNMQLQESIMQIQDSYWKLQDSHGKLQESHGKLQESHGTLPERFEKLEESHDKLQEGHKKLQESNGKLQEKVLSLENENTYVKFYNEVCQMIIEVKEHYGEITPVTHQRISNVLVHSSKPDIFYQSLINTRLILKKSSFIKLPMDVRDSLMYGLPVNSSDFAEMGNYLFDNIQDYSNIFN